MLSFSLIYNTNIFDFTHFIFFNPLELFKIHFFFILYFSSVFALPFCLWIILDFLVSSLKKKKYLLLRKIILIIILIYSFLNYFSFLFILPNIWLFFQNFNKFLSKLQFFSFSFELRLGEYYNFLYDFINITNLFFITCVSIVFIINGMGLNFFISRRKLFIFTNILFSTLLSPPEIITQLLLFVFFNFFLELLKLFFIFKIKIDNNTIKLIRHHVK